MNLIVVLLSPDDKLRSFFGRSRESIIPPEALSRGYFAKHQVTVSVAAYVPDEEGPSARAFEQMLLVQANTSSLIILLIDEAWEYLAANVRNAAFCLIYKKEEIDKNYRNFFHRSLSKLLRSFSSVASIFDNGDDTQLVSLPIRNFDAESIREFARICRDENLTSDFINKLQVELSELRHRRRPRRRSEYRTHYVVDEKKRFFVFGKERHSRFSTGEPHKPYCEVNGHFRFGIRIDSSRHYNVSETEHDVTTIVGIFADCHGLEHQEKGDKTHLNMFSNDFF